MALLGHIGRRGVKALFFTEVLHYLARIQLTVTICLQLGTHGRTRAHTALNNTLPCAPVASPQAQHARGSVSDNHAWLTQQEVHVHVSVLTTTRHISSNACGRCARCRIVVGRRACIPYQRSSLGPLRSRRWRLCTLTWEHSAGTAGCQHAYADSWLHASCQADSRG